METKLTGKKYKINTHKWPGVYGYQSSRRRAQGRPDVCFYITYRDGSRLRWEKVGWKADAAFSHRTAKAIAKEIICRESGMSKRSFSSIITGENGSEMAVYRSRMYRKVDPEGC